jgi:2-polyprenyl-6-methoxyphenol hydroxylase-like FAD-dependent oxidoreductase
MRLWAVLPPQGLIQHLALRFDRGRLLAVRICVAKGGSEEIRQKGIEHLRAGIVEIAPFLRDRVSELSDWSEIKLLTVRVDRLRQWYLPGLLCIGDAAHAMSPIGGIGN